MQKNHRVQKNHRIQKNQRSRNPGILQAFPTHRINTGKTCRNSFQRKLYFQKKQFATQNGKNPQKTSGVQEMVLRNIAPREGTETPVNTSYRRSTLIKKYSSPRGDGNIKPVRVKVIPCTALRNIAPREGTEIHIFTTNHSYLFIKKYSSPRGDGNEFFNLSFELFNRIKKYSSPRGDGNVLIQNTHPSSLSN